LVAQHPEGLVGLDIHGRTRYVEHLLETWLRERPPDLWRRPPSAGSADETHDRLQWAVRITTLSHAALSRPYGTRQAAEDHIAHIHATGSDGHASRFRVELVWRRMHPWSTGEPGPCDLT